MKLKLLIVAITLVSVQSFAQIAEYSFDNTLNNNAGNTAFTTNSSLSFTADRHSNATGALNINGAGTTAAIANLPVGSSERTISIWVKSSLGGSNNYIFSYGNASDNAACGLSKTTVAKSTGGYKPTIYYETNLIFFGWANDLKQLNPTLTGNWTHYVTTYSATGVASIYINGALVLTQPKAGWNTANTVFRLGQTPGGADFFTGAVDDLKIYDKALSAVEVTNLHNLVEAAPAITNISSSYTGSGTKIDYSINPNGLATTSVINYGLSADALTNQVPGGSASGIIIPNLSTTLSSLVKGTTYFYQIVATNSMGSTPSVVKSFVNDASPAIVEYDFDGDIKDRNGANTLFAVDANATFVADRNSNLSSALRLNNTYVSGTITNLPVGSSPRTVSLWVKIPNASTDNHIFFYGNLAVNQSYGLSVQGNKLVNFGYGNDLTAVGYGIAGTNWVHVVTTFDGTTAKIYYNGLEKISGNKSNWNTTSSAFKLGAAFDITVDELKIYDKALVASEVENLYNFGSTNQTSALSNVQANVLSVYPNPASDRIRFANVADNTMKEIYTLQGNKIMETTENSISIANLPAGLYLIKVTTSDNKTLTSKFRKI